MSLLIREMQAGDVPSVYKLQEMLAFQKWSEAQILAEIFLPCAVTKVAYDGGLLVGYAIFHVIADEAELLSIAVDPTRQREGIAKAIYAETLSELKSREVQTLFLEVRVRNIGAQQFYQSLGFVETYRRKRYYADGEDAVIMKGSL